MTALTDHHCHFFNRGTEGNGSVMGGWLVLMVLVIFSHVNDSTILTAGSINPKELSRACQPEKKWQRLLLLSQIG